MDYLLKYRAIELALAGGDSMPFHLQPVMNLATHEIVAYEILYRGSHPRTVEGWAQIDGHVIAFLGMHRLPLPEVLVNLSNYALLRMEHQLFSAAASRNNVCFELSESNEDSNYDAIAAKANGLLKRGIRIAIDDFGAGLDGLMRYGSLSRVSVVKIDRKFLQLALKTMRIRGTLNHLTKLWRDHQVQIIAEGVETEMEYMFAQDLNVDMVQGFYVDDMTAGTDHHLFTAPLIERARIHHAAHC